MGTMLLGGLWHGASWTFVVWGGLHGFYLAIERVVRSRWTGAAPGPLGMFALGAATYALVNIAWVFFRAKSFGGAWVVLKGMFGLNAEPVPILAFAHLVAVVVIVGGLVATHSLMRSRTLESVIARTPSAVIAVGWALLAFAIVIEQGTGDAFIYFQF
jgi:alginate O-acetyltransferase complex protein AlgI